MSRQVLPGAYAEDHIIWVLGQRGPVEAGITWELYAHLKQDFENTCKERDEYKQKLVDAGLYKEPETQEDRLAKLEATLNVILAKLGEQNGPITSNTNGSPITVPTGVIKPGSLYNADAPTSSFRGGEEISEFPGGTSAGITGI